MTIDSVSNLIDAIARLMWPVLAAVVLILNWSSVKRLFGRLQRLSAGPVAFDFGVIEEKAEKIKDELDAEAQAAPQVEVVTVPPSAPGKESAGGANLSRAEVALLIVQVEEETRRVTEGSRPMGTFPSLRARSRYLPPNVREVVADLIPLRNAVIHGEALSQEDMNAASSLAREVLAVLRGLPVVAHPSLTLYEDREATRARSDVAGVQVSTSSQEGEVELRVFPTTRSYAAGAIVTLEFGSRSWNTSWYRDPKSDEVRLAFGSSVEFTGRIRQ